MRRAALVVLGATLIASACDERQSKAEDPAPTPIAGTAPSGAGASESAGKRAPAGGTAPSRQQNPTAAPAPARTSAPAREPVAAAGTGFDFYVLALSWSPTFCAIDDGASTSGQCRPGRDLGFIVHGLWPQFEKGYPERCASREPDRVPDELVRRIIDLIPSAGLIGHQWRKHGTCTGLSQKDYFVAVREARERVVVPERFARSPTAGKAEPRAVEAAFIAANPGLPPGGIAVSCEKGKLDEVRVCLTRGLEFRPCPEIERQSCRAATVDLPAAP